MLENTKSYLFVSDC